VPHPEAERRLFVLAPLSELDPDLEPPGWHERVADTCARVCAAEGPGSVVLVGRWDARTGSWTEETSAGSGACP
jgi:hypothetical protein